jgi:hypothetical protein
VGGERHAAANQRHCVAARQASSSENDKATGMHVQAHWDASCTFMLHDRLDTNTSQHVAMSHAVQAAAAPGEGLHGSDALMGAANSLANMRVLESGYDIK